MRVVDLSEIGEAVIILLSKFLDRGLEVVANLSELTGRELGKARRRAAIVEAAKSYIREESDFSAERIAKRAEVSTATVYNLIGRREQIVAIIFNSIFEGAQDRIDSVNESDPVLLGEAVIDAIIKAAISDAKVTKMAITEMSGTMAATISKFIQPRPFANIGKVIADAAKKRKFTRTSKPEVIAWQVLIYLDGALSTWSGDFINNTELMTEAKRGYWAAIACYGTRSTRELALNRLQTMPVNNELQRHLTTSK